MKKKRLFLLLAVLAAFVAVFFIKTVFAGTITKEQLQNVENTDVLREIGETVIRDTKNTTLPESELPGRIEVYMENVLGDEEEEAIISVFYGPKYNITAVYEPVNGAYEFAGSLGTFFSPRDVIVKNFRKGNPIIFLSDYVNQQAGAFEDSTYLYGYTWNNESGEFINVFTEPMNINAQWLENGTWQKAERKGKAVYENSQVPNIKAEFDQSYYTAQDDGSQKQPSAEEYSLAEQWVENEMYYWSDEWQRFIIKEMIEKATGEKVAVVGRWEKLPYTRTPEFQQYTDYKRIIRKDGSTEPLPNDALSEIEVKTILKIEET